MKFISFPEVIPVWPEKSSGEEIWSRQEQETTMPQASGNTRIKNLRVVRNYTQPTLTVFLPEPSVANGTAIIVCPGGGFMFLSVENEGTAVARWLNARGIAAFVLRYRLLPTPASDEDFLRHMQHPDMEQMKPQIPLSVADGRQSVKIVRERAAEWGIAPQRIGILGFSAGGVVAVGAAAHDEVNNRPDFVGSIYSPGWHDFTNQTEMPPLFLTFASDDPALSLVSDGSLQLYSAWKASRRPVELHIYSKGEHGFGMAQQGLPSDHWIERFADWLHLHGYGDPQLS